MSEPALQRERWMARLATPGGVLAASLVAALSLMLLPQTWLAPLRGAAAAALKPGQQSAAAVRARAEDALAAVRRHFDTAAQLAEAQKEIASLRAENARLSARLGAAGSSGAADGSPRPRAFEASGVSDGSPRPGHRAAVAGEGQGVRAGPADPDRLLVAGTVRANVLGVQARAFLKRLDLLDAGSRDGVERDAWVLDPSPALIDRGLDCRLEPGHLALDGARVWGRVVEVAPRTSTVQRATEPGYRDVVRLAAPGEAGAPPRLGPEGILEGTGEPLARVRMVPVSEPVEKGDLVYTSSAGVLPRPLLYGRVARVERPVGASHWEIWMEPAADARRPEELAVLKIQLNPHRVAQKASP